jgi:predicted transcriptional regulator
MPNPRDPDRCYVSSRLDKEQSAALDVMAREEDRNRSQLVRRAVREMLERRNTNGQKRPKPQPAGSR